MVLVHHVFLSYCREDTPLMTRVRDDLRTASLDVWTDEGIKPGTQSWKHSIEKAILGSVCLVAILSPDALESRWVRAEMDFAELHGKPIYLILARGEDRAIIPFGYAASQWIDVRDPEYYAQQMQELVDAVNHRIQNPEPAVPPMLPQPFGWCRVPRGEVTMHLDAHEHVMTVDEFYISRYPITNAQYQAFIDAPDGYTDKRWWDFSKQAAAWRQKNPRTRESAFTGSEHPRDSVTWFEAVAFCRWVSFKTGLSISLPTEAQWQLAAQGGDKRLFPWDQHYSSSYRFADVNSLGGMEAAQALAPAIIDMIDKGPVALQAEMVTNLQDREQIQQLLVELSDKVDASLCNTYENGLASTTPVTRYPQGASPYGVMDTAGNVWEWCRSSWNDPIAPLGGNSPRVLRGGSWAMYQYTARLTHRTREKPNARAEDVGFRVICTM